MTAAIAEEVRRERLSQDMLWGEQNYPSVHADESAEMRCIYSGLPTEAEAKHRCKVNVEMGALTFADIATEELCEAVAAPDEVKRREELIQTVAVLVAWVEMIDRNKETT